MLKIVPQLVSVADLCHDGHYSVTKSTFVSNLETNIVGIGKHIDGMDAVGFKKMEKQQVLPATEKYVSVLDFCHVRLDDDDCRAIKWMGEKDAVQDMDMCQRFVLDDCFPCIKGTMTNTPMPSRTHVEVRPGAVIHTDVAFMKGPSIAGARYFIISMDKESFHVGAFHMNLKDEAADLLKCHAG